MMGIQPTDSYPQSANLCHSSVHNAVITWKRKLEAMPDKDKKL